MDFNLLKIKELCEGCLPAWSGNGNGNAGLDLKAAEDAVLLPGKITMVPLGIATEFPSIYVAILKDRSGMATKGCHLLGGVIDCSYRGEWKAIIVNLSSDNYVIRKCDRVAQALFVPIMHLRIERVESLSDSTRGVSGFGASGK